MYLAPFEGEHYRARVDSVNDHNRTASVFFIDFGNIRDNVLLEELVPITDQGIVNLGRTARKLVETPALALECSLVQTRPNPQRGDRLLFSLKLRFH